MIRMWQEIQTTNDNNGNPRKAWIVYPDHNGRARIDGVIANTLRTQRGILFVAFDYEGRPAYLDRRREGVSIDVFPAEFKRLRKYCDEITLYELNKIFGEYVPCPHTDSLVKKQKLLSMQE